jgi:hypothetical protein
VKPIISSYEKPLYRLLTACMLLLAAGGFLRDGPLRSLQGFLQLQMHSARLINDYTVIGGSGGALLNAAIMGLLALALIKTSRISLSGPTVAAVFTITGFSLFGKTPLNALPIVAGVFLASRVAHKPFGNYILMALFGTALGPLVSFLVCEAGLSGPAALPAGLAAGCLAGFILPALAMAMLRMHEGFNLYNIGLTCGFFGLFAAAVLSAAGRDLSAEIIWNEHPGMELILQVPLMSLLLIATGIRMDGRKTLINLRRIIRQSGRLPSDFMSGVAPGAALVNAGLLGLGGTLYLLLIRADINGPVIGGLLTMMGFATFGKHPRNCWPIALGVIAATLLFGKSLTEPGPVLALLFGTTLAPLAGEFGRLIGFAAGFVHLTLVEQSAAWHGGLDLYNNGFAGGLTATLFVAVIQWRRANRPAEPDPKPRSQPSGGYYGQ